MTLRLQAHDPDCASEACTSGCGAYIRDDLTQWATPAGTLEKAPGVSSSPYAGSASWQAPTVEGTYTITVSVSDSGTWICGNRQTVSGTLDVLVTASTNQPPVITAVTASPPRLLPGQSAALRCAASDPDGDAITFAWTSDTGTLSSTGAAATFVASQPGVATVTCSATDSKGASASRPVTVAVSDALEEKTLRQGLETPLRVSVDSIGNVYVADRGGVAVLKLADSAALVDRIPIEGVTSVAVDWQDRLLVGGASGARVMDRGGRTLLRLDPGEPLGPVADVAVDRARHRYGVLHGSTSRVVVYDDGGAQVGGVGVAGDGPSEIRIPQGVAFTPAGDVVIADSGHAAIKVFGLDGTLRISFGGNGTGAGRFVRLDDVEVDAAGVIYASDAYQAWVQAFNPDGTLRDVIGTFGDGLGQFKTPAGIAVASAYSRLIVASVNTPSLEVFRMSGQPVSERTPQPLLSPRVLRFPSTPVGTASAAQAITLSNTGSAPLGIHQIVVSGEFRQSNDCGLALDPGQACTLRISYVPETAGAVFGSVTLETSATPASLVVTLSGRAFLPPMASLVPNRLAFGDQRVGTTSASQAVTLANTHQGTLSVGAITATAGFGVATGCGGSALLPGQSCVFDVVFTPLAAGQVSGMLTIDSDAVNRPLVVSLSGVGVHSPLSVQPDQVDFGSYAVRDKSQQTTVIITNVSTGTLAISDAMIAGPDAAQFQLVTNNCTGATLAAGAACKVGVAFRPTAVGQFTASLRVLAAARDSLDLAALSGTGVTAPRQLIFQDTFESGALSSWSAVVPGDAVLTLDGSTEPQSFDAGSAPVGARRSVTVHVVNRQDSAVDVGSLVVDGARGAFLQLERDDCSGKALGPAETCDVVLELKAANAGPGAGTVVVSTSGGAATLRIAAEGHVSSESQR